MRQSAQESQVSHTHTHMHTCILILESFFWLFFLNTFRIKSKVCVCVSVQFYLMGPVLLMTKRPE